MKAEEQVAELRAFMEEEFLPVWRGQVDDWSDGVNYIAKKTGWKPESIRTEILPWIYEWNRQKDAADRAGKFMAELPNVGVFFRKQKWKNPLPYSFQELNEQTGEKKTEICACGQPAFNRTQCPKCYAKAVDPNFKDGVKENLRRLGFTKKPGETWREASMRCLEQRGIKSHLPEHLK